jgi:pimeloyl-ACP methyl ester carboxylesterase
VRGEFLDLSGARLYYFAAGTRGAGVPVVFIHGFPTSSHLWGNVIPLIPPGYRLVVLDLLGYGRSDRPLSHPVDAGAHATRIVEMFDELRIDRACVVGHGIGGGIAQLLAARFPARVSHLCLVDSAGFDRWPTFAGPVARSVSPAASVLPPRALIRLLRTDLLGAYSDRERASHSIDLYLRPFDCAEGRDALIAHMRGLSGIESLDLTPQLAAITAPTAIVWGDQDRVIPVSIGTRLRGAIAGATLDVIPNAGHFTPEEAPRQVADVIQALLQR